MSKYVQRENWEGWAVRNRVPFRISCCDCGLVHNFVITVIILTLFVIHGLAEIRDELRKLNKKGD